MKYARELPPTTETDFQRPEPKDEWSPLFKDLVGGVLLMVLVFANLFFILGL